MRKFFGYLHRFTDSSVFYALKCLGGNNLSDLFSRIRRLRKLMSAMVNFSQSSPLPVRLQIETTNACNFRCRMCAREAIELTGSAEIPLDNFDRLLKEIKPFYVTLNGLGEPLLDKTIFEKLELLSRYGIMSSMPTNGSLIHLNLEKLAQNMPDILQFSIDGATKKTFESIRLNSNFEKVIGNYKSILDLWQSGRTRENCEIRVSSTLQKKNMYEFRETFELFKSMNALNLINLVPIFDFSTGVGEFDDEFPTDDEIRKLDDMLDEAIKNASEEESNFFKLWREAIKSIVRKDPLQEKIDSGKMICLIPWYNSYISANGDVYPCCYLLGKPEHVMGNIFRNKFTEIWNDSRYMNFRKCLVRNRKFLPGCATCPKDQIGLFGTMEKIASFF